MKNIKTIDLSGCRSIQPISVINTIKHFGPTLENIILRRCIEIDDSVLLAISEYNNNIRTLSLSNCKKITDYGMCKIAEKCKSIEKLGLGSCSQLTDTCMIQICKSLQHKLTTIGLNGITKITDVTLEHIQQYCTNMEILSLSQLNSLSPLAMENLTTTCHQLGSIDLAKCTRMDDNVLFSIAKHCPLLFQLNVTSTSITDEGIISVAMGCPGLRLALLGSCNVTDDSIKILASCCRLEVLTLNKCGAITEKIFEYLNTTPPMPLKYLDVIGTFIPLEAKISFLSNNNINNKINNRPDE